MGALTDALATAECPELLLVRSLVAPNDIPFTRTGDRITDLILCAVSDQSYPDLVYENDCTDLTNPERHWCHAKLTSTSYPSVNSTLSGYDLTHSVFYATDFTRSPIVDQDAQNRLLDVIVGETHLDLLVEYAICLKSVGGTPDSNLIDALLAIDYTGNEHLMYVLAMAEANGVI